LAASFTFLRNTRNAVEHPEPGQEVILQDYRLKADGGVYPPTITVIEKHNPLSETDLRDYFQWALTLLINAFEAFLVNLCAIHIKPFTGFETVITKLEPDERRYYEVAYCYAAWLGDRLVPYAD
jgi:hypothetical protein